MSEFVQIFTEVCLAWHSVLQSTTRTGLSCVKIMWLGGVLCRVSGVWYFKEVATWFPAISRCWDKRVLKVAFKQAHNITVLSLINIWATAYQNQQMTCAPNEDSDQPGQESSLFTWWKVGIKRSGKTDQTGQMPRLIWVFTGRTDHFVGFVLLQLNYVIYLNVSKVNFLENCGHVIMYLSHS